MVESRAEALARLRLAQIERGRSPYIGDADSLTIIAAVWHAYLARSGGAPGALRASQAPGAPSS